MQPKQELSAIQAADLLQFDDKEKTLKVVCKDRKFRKTLMTYLKKSLYAKKKRTEFTYMEGIVLCGGEWEGTYT